MILAIVFLPLIGALFSGVANKKLPDWFSEYFNTSLLAISAILSYLVFYDVVFGQVIYNVELFNWINSGDFQVNWSLNADSLTAVMLVVVTTVSMLVHLYSIGYMEKDESIPRFMSYISLFTFFMLMLVTSTNLVQLFFGWEGVGLCSYLLIGFWYKKESAYNAAIKAFLVNRVADVFFVIGIFTVFYLFGSIEFSEIFNKASSLASDDIKVVGFGLNVIDFACICLFIGCMGKSAQLGFHTWLPDAMEGPTPVSALIHAATMVTAGVFLVARFSPVFEMSPTTLEMIIFIGATTAIFAATIAMAQNDIKKIIAYSTCSQLGYMFFACGVSAYSVAIFHLATHAFFKALLFLCAGCIIHAMSDEQDINKMGGLYKKIPITFSLVVIGSLAISGIPPFAGYYSKDAILESALSSDRLLSNYAYICGTLGAVCTAFYSWRLIIKVFHGECKASKKSQLHIHEPPLTMLIPIATLGIGAVFAGVGAVYGFGIIDENLSFWHGSLEQINQKQVLAGMHHINEFLKFLPLTLSIMSIGVAYIIYMHKPKIVDVFVKRYKFIYQLVSNKYYFDEAYNKIFVAPYRKIAGFCYSIIDKSCIDLYGPGLVAKTTKSFSAIVSRAQTGFIYHYLLILFLGIISFVSFILLVF
ncbi:MAG: NADH-quinone oxidoreductase subunit L [Rickettsiales bacterium]